MVRLLCYSWMGRQMRCARMICTMLVRWERKPDAIEWEAARDAAPWQHRVKWFFCPSIFTISTISLLSLSRHPRIWAARSNPLNAVNGNARCDRCRESVTNPSLRYKTISSSPHRIEQVRQTSTALFFLLRGMTSEPRRAHARSRNTYS